MTDYRQFSRSALGNLKLHLTGRELAASLTIVGIATMIGLAVEPHTGRVSTALIFVLAITATGTRYGLAAALVAAAIEFALFNYFIAEPRLSISFSSGRDIAQLLLFSLIALMSGVLAGRLQDRARAIQRSNLQLASLLEASQQLQSAIDPIEVISALEATAPARLGIEFRVFHEQDGKLVETGPPSPDGGTGLWAEAAEITWLRQAPHHQVNNLSAFLLRGAASPVGVLVSNAHPDDPAAAVEPSFLAALANLLALALERAALSERVTESRATARSEQLKTALLSSVSHDFRTPLTAISASAGSLLDYEDRLPAEARRKLLKKIVDESGRLNRYTANLLELSKLQTEQPFANAQVVDVTEIIAAASQHIEPRLAARRLDRSLPRSTLLVRADPALFELVLVNVLDNAILYSDDGTSIEISARVDEHEIEIAISDEGIGIPPQERERVFERFVRGAAVSAHPHGSGLGLAIARSFVQSFGGRIWADAPGIGDRGTRIVIRLPRIEGVAA